MFGNQTVLEQALIGNSKVPADGQEFTLEMTRADALAILVDPLGLVRESLLDSKKWNCLNLLPPPNEPWPRTRRFRLIPHAMVIEDQKRIDRWVREVGCRLASAYWLRPFRRQFPRPVGIAGPVVFGGKGCQWRNPESGNSVWASLLKPASCDRRVWETDFSVTHAVPSNARWLTEVLQ